MKHIRLEKKDDLEHLRDTTQVDISSDSSINQALIFVAREIAELLKQAYLAQAEDSDRN